ncbi:Peptidase E [Bacillus subtilis]|nr:Peptidase E [Bacillus subtilis]
MLTNQEYLWDKDFVQWETTSFVFLAAPDKKVFDFVSCFYTKCYNKQQILLGGVMMKQIIAMGGRGFFDGAG